MVLVSSGGERESSLNAMKEMTSSELKPPSDQSTADLQDSELVYVLERLDSKDDEQILAAVVRVRNLIIGNNKFKSFFLNDALLGRLMVILRESSDLSGLRSELVSQIVIMFGSYALGTLTHVIKLVQTFQLHKFLFDFLASLDQASVASKHLVLVESSLRCLSNIYTTSQPVPSIVYALDQVLYGSSSSASSALSSLLNIFALSNITKQTVINIIAISSSNFLVSSINLTPSSFLAKSSSKTLNARASHHHQLINDNQYFIYSRNRISQFRSSLIRSSAICQFATLLTHMQPNVQLNALKFYSAICFENYEASMAILTCQYYNMPLVELISAYLNGDNSAELQLYAAKCLTNLCRSTTSRLVATKSEAICVSPKASPEGVVDYSSPLIRQRTLTTLIHLCYTCSTNHRRMVNDGGPASFLGPSVIGSGIRPRMTRLTDSVNQSLNAFLLIQCLTTLIYLIELNSELQEKASHLEQIISTISHNISDAYQALNTSLNGPASAGQSMNALSLLSKESLKHKQSQEDVDKATKQRCPSRKNRRSLRLRHLQNAKKNQQKHQRQKNANARKQVYAQAPPLSGGISSEDQTASNWTEPIEDDQSKPTVCVQSSLFSSFYVKYNQFAAKGIHLRLNEHQYRLTSVLSSVSSNLIESYDRDRQRQELCNQRKLLRPIKFLKNLTRSTNKVLIAVSFHALAAFASNSEEARRQISDYSGVMAHILNCLDMVVVPSIRRTSDDEEASRNEHGYSLDESTIRPDEDDEQALAEDSGSSEESEDELADSEDFDIFDEMDAVERESSSDDESSIGEDPACIMRFSALCLLHSLSRSVHQLRTKFLDQKIWRNLLDLMHQARRESAHFLQPQLNSKSIKSGKLDQSIALLTAASQEEDNDESDAMMTTCCMTPEMQKFSEENEDEDGTNERAGGQLASLNDESEQNFICILTAIFSNLLLEFSPSKELMFGNGIIRVLADLLNHRNLSVKINCMWALMNMAFNAEQKVKQEILSSVTIEKLFQLLTEKNETLIMKTLGLLRNLISFRPHVDLIMTIYGTKIIQAVIMVLESDLYNVRIKEQALTILVNVADGTVSKEFIMDNEDLLRKINSFMTYNCVELQITAVCCVANLVLSTDDGASERQGKLKDMGAHRILQKLMHSTDSALLEKVKFALAQFSSSSSISSLSFSGTLGSGGGVASSSSSSSSSTSINSSSAT